MMLRILCLALTIAVASAGNMKFIDCGHHEVMSLDVSGCQGEFCVIHKGKKVELDMKVKSNQNSEKLQLVVEASVNGVDIEIPGIDKNGCHYVQCPVVKDKVYEVKYSQEIPKALPNMKANVTAKVIGDHGMLGCVKLQGELKD